VTVPSVHSARRSEAASVGGSLGFELLNVARVITPRNMASNGSAEELTRILLSEGSGLTRLSRAIPSQRSLSLLRGENFTSARSVPTPSRRKRGMRFWRRRTDGRCWHNSEMPVSSRDVRVRDCTYHCNLLQAKLSEFIRGKAPLVSVGGVAAGLAGHAAGPDRRSDTALPTGR
jgi:hypothetical protein